MDSEHTGTAHRCPRGVPVLRPTGSDSRCPVAPTEGEEGWFR
ncbi:hypothetical protein EBESD8_54590 [Rhodococcus aetherivorans]|nr:hypothetical protein EBESD8_54590 [Rhodococcus aetherivorans]